MIQYENLLNCEINSDFCPTNSTRLINQSDKGQIVEYQYQKIRLSLPGISL